MAVRPVPISREGHRVALKVSAPLAGHVLGVDLAITQKEVVRANAVSNVAVVENARAVGDRPVVDDVRDAMRELGLLRRYLGPAVSGGELSSHSQHSSVFCTRDQKRATYAPLAAWRVSTYGLTLFVSSQ